MGRLTHVGGEIVRLKVGVSDEAAGTVGFEPVGMFYELGPGEYLYACLNEVQLRSLEVTSWSGGVSLWVRGEFVVLDSRGNVLDEIWGG
ncbi:hypothetical protein LX15_003831 [Streptoalloteichus tenebrarius]|uniref:Uncharacterized protein n=1 Tax=Streptoalloteichus tenebrarius (strain ATCC 17920 / DSM 40477 / JCM 4838 / CBS 697.72 / NBRC 16177 / NCIMB 11028 / NRRL B-12390 / A12253. 1 / ISP 5477) TaxID=1933 RepID=A0ABT1HXK9_STRSD|nr:hypothetical protein [Streptoalloteichus tenebrarius]MCP2260120.1 hypothetical protein [Streptoalloteichus tenebrarius]BFF00557.1 hypothetical protein GCM10020241_22320 [Streptoalloteichus tenebrarius]